MHPDLALVRDLQDLDRRIAELTREIGYLPKHIAEIESRLESHRRRLEADRAALTANQKERRRLEDDIKVFEGKMAKLRDQMSEAKTNEVYRAFQHEIEFAQGEIRKIEDRILEHMSEAVGPVSRDDTLTVNITAVGTTDPSRRLVVSIRL